MDVSAIDRIESPIAASMLATGHDPKEKQYDFSNERDDFNLARVNLTHNMQEQAELYQEVIQFEKLIAPKEVPKPESISEIANAVPPTTLNGYASAYFGGSGTKPNTVRETEQYFTLQEVARDQRELTKEDLADFQPMAVVEEVPVASQNSSPLKYKPTESASTANEFVDLEQVKAFLDQLTDDFESQYFLEGSKRVIFNTFVNLFTYTLQKFKTIESKKNFSADKTTNHKKSASHGVESARKDNKLPRSPTKTHAEPSKTSINAKN